MAKRGPKQCPCLYRPNPAPQQKALLPNKDETETPHACGESQAEKRIHPYPAPRAWGRPVDFLTHLVAVGNTPTCVGKTSTYPELRLFAWKHPHARGEDPESFLPVRMTPLATWAIFRPLPTKYMPGWLRARFQGMGEGGTWLSGKRSLPIERFPPSRGRCLRIGLAGGTATRCPRRFSSAFRAAMPAFFHPHWWKKPRCTRGGPISLFSQHTIIYQ